MRYYAIVGALALALAGCGGDDGGSGDGKLTVYSGREEELVEPLLQKFEEESGTDLEVRYGDSAELAATIAEEGDNSPADVFFAQDRARSARSLSGACWRSCRPTCSSGWTSASATPTDAGSARADGCA